MSYHRDREVNQKVIELLDALYTWERETGRGSTLILIPDRNDGDIFRAQDGKPVPNNLPLHDFVQVGLHQRDKT